VYQWREKERMEEKEHGSKEESGKRDTTMKSSPGEEKAEKGGNGKIGT